MRHPVDYAPSQDFGDNPTKNLPSNHWIIAQFGNYQPDGHTGVDYPCPVGTPVRAVADGKVVHVGYYSGSYADNPYWISPGFAGYCYVVDHGSFIGIYGHCAEDGARVRLNQQVIEGQVLGLSGNTGASTGPHLHFEVLPDGYVLNSYMYGRINPATLFGAASLAPAGDIITQLEEAGMSLDTSDREFLQTVINQNADRVILDSRWQVEHWAKQVIETVKDSSYEVKAFVHGVDNANADRVIIDNRAEEAATREAAN